MNRKDFLKRVGLGALAIPALPSVLAGNMHDESFDDLLSDLSPESREQLKRMFAAQKQMENIAEAHMREYRAARLGEKKALTAETGSWDAGDCLNAMSNALLSVPGVTLVQGRFTEHQRHDKTATSWPKMILHVGLSCLLDVRWEGRHLIGFMFLEGDETCHEDDVMFSAETWNESPFDMYEPQHDRGMGLSRFFENPRAL